MNLTHWLYSLSPSPTQLLLLIALIAMLESLAVVGIVVPGVVLLGAAASLAGHQELSLWPLLIAGVVGAFAGDSLSFWLGRTQRARIPHWWPFTRHPDWLARGHAFFERYGTLSIVLGRFVGPVRPFVPLIAGMLSMSSRRFLTVNALSALAWAPVYLLPGYWLGQTWDRMMTLPPGAERWLIALSVSLLALGLLFSWFRYQLSSEGRVHRWLDRRRPTHPKLGALWLALRSPAPEGTFPLASLALMLTSLVGLIAWTGWVLLHDGPLPMDRDIHGLMAMIEQQWLIGSSQTLAEIGDKLGITVLMSPWLLWLLWARRFAALLHLGGALAAVGIINTAFKRLAGRARPDTPDYLTGSLSYPSAHTSTIVVVIGLTAAFAAQVMPQRYRAYAYWTAIVVCAPMALSRLVIGVHWASDLIGGALLGLLVCAITRVSYQRYQRHDRDMPPWFWLGGASLGLTALRVLLLPPV